MDLPVLCLFKSRFPILWLTGYYTLVNSVLFGFIPLKARRGDFNIDIKDVTVGVIVTVGSNETEEGVPTAAIDTFEIGISWKNLAFKFDKIAGRFTTLADLTINEVLS